MFGLSATAVAAIAAVGSAGFSAFGAVQQADAQKKALNYQAQVEANNTKIQAYNRSIALQQGEIDTENAMTKQTALLSDQRASLAANGMDVTDSGSALDLLATTKFLGSQDVNTIQNNAARQAWGYDVQASNDQAVSTLDKWRASQISPVGIGVMTGMSSLLSSASQFAMASGFSSNKGTTSGGGKS